MSKFPNPILLPDQVYQDRESRNKQVLQAARIGIGIRLAIILFEFIGVLFTHSSALFTDAIASLMDVFSTVFLIFCVRMAKRPPNENYPFGHGRYEPLGGLLLGIFLSIMGAVLLIQQLFGFTQEETVKIHSFAWIFSLVAMVLLEVCYHIVLYVAKKQNSSALLAEAMHYRVDSLTSFVATIALIAAFYGGDWSGWLDHAGAILIAVLMIGMGFYAAMENFHQIMDRTPDENFFKKVRAAALSVRGVKETEKIRIQSYGPDAHVDIDIEVDPHLSVDLAHQISQQVRAEIQKTWPAVRDVTVHIEPYYENDH